MPTGPLFSIIVPTFERPQLLKEALDSVLAQSIADFECIVVDDASPEPPVLPDDRRILLVRRSTNGGLSAARNMGLDSAYGKYVVFLDDDDVFTPERLAIGMEGLARAPISICWAGGTGTAGRTSWALSLEGDVGDSILEEFIPHMGQVTMARALVPRFDERFRVKEDTEWWIRAAQLFRVTTVPRVGYVWRWHEGPGLMSSDADRMRGNLLLLETHEEFFAQHPRFAAIRWRRVGGAAYRLGENRLARKALGQAVRLDPDPRTLALLIRTSIRAVLRPGKRF